MCTPGGNSILSPARLKIVRLRNSSAASNEGGNSKPEVDIECKQVFIKRSVQVSTQQDYVVWMLNE